MNTYVDCITYSKAPTGLNLSGQIGNIGRLAATAQGVTSLTVLAGLTVALNQYDAIYVTDGPNSEVLQVGSGGASQGATSIPLQGSGTQYAHAAGVAYCTDGAQGSLGQSIFEASRWIEDICHQPLWSTTYTGEILTMPTMRASMDNQNNLHFRPRHFPITALSAVSIEISTLYSLAYDPTQAIIDGDQQTVDLPNLALLPSQQGQIAQANPWYVLPFNRQSNAWITLTYTAGFAVGSLPYSVQRAATLLTSEMFGQMTNPVGADDIGQGKRRVTFTLRGDLTGESLLAKQAMKLLSPYISQSF